MNAMRFRSARIWLGMTAAAFGVAGCNSESAVGPEETAAASPLAAAAEAARGVDLGSCDSLRAPEGSTLAFRTYAEGVQIYEWTGAAWQFKRPSATLYASAGGTGVVGIHYGGPTWEANTGGFIVGRLSKRCDVSEDDIAWLLLDVTRNEGPGVFSRVTHIQRLNTVGGIAPSEGGSQVGEIRNVPYSAVYYFYRAR